MNGMRMRRYWREALMPIISGGMAWAIAVSSWGAQRTWTGSGDMNWAQPDSTSWDAAYAYGDDVLFSGAGTGTIEIVGTVNPGGVVFTHTAGIYTFTGGTNQLHASGSFSNIGSGIVQFGNMGSTPLAGLTWTGGTYIANGSELRLTRATVVGLPATAVNLDGGIISFGADNSAAYLVACGGPGKLDR